MFIRQIIGIVGNSKKSFRLLHKLVWDLDFITPCCSATSSLLYTLTNYRGGGKAPLARRQYVNEPPQLANFGIPRSAALEGL